MIDGKHDGAAVLIEDANNALIDNVVASDESPWPEYGILFRIRANERFRVLRIRNVLAEDVQVAGIVLENASSSNRLESYLNADNIATIRDDFKAHRTLVDDNVLPR